MRFPHKQGSVHSLLSAISPMLEMSPALHLHTELDQCGQQHLASECRGSITYLCLKDYSREKGENIPLVMTTFSYLTVK